MPTDPDFDAMYDADPDPWDVATSWYERRKLAVLLASLPRERYASAWEPGCGPGLTTRALAARVDRLVASDGSAVAIGLAHRRCAGLAHVDLRISTLPDVPLDAPVDLVVAAEFLFYLADHEAALEALWESTAPGGHLVLLHWRHQAEDANLSGEQLHEQAAAVATRRGAGRLVHHQDVEFRLDVYERQS